MGMWVYIQEGEEIHHLYLCLFVSPKDAYHFTSYYRYTKSTIDVKPKREGVHYYGCACCSSCCCCCDALLNAAGPSKPLEGMSCNSTS